MMCYMAHYIFNTLIMAHFVFDMLYGTLHGIQIYEGLTAVSLHEGIIWATPCPWHAQFR